MKCKTFTGPNDPRTCRLQASRATALHKYPGGTYRLEDLGVKQRILTGEGEFFGNMAYTDMDQLIRVYEEPGEGLLIHPLIRLRKMMFTELEILEEPRAWYVAYRFTFTECDTEEYSASRQKPGSSGSYIAQPGDTLYAISMRSSVPLTRLLVLNPEIKNPNVLTAGQVVRLA